MYLHGILFSIFAIQSVLPANILCLLPHVGKSHFLVFEPLLKNLARRGHEVTVASFFPQENPPGNYTDVSLQDIAQMRKEAIDLQVFEKSSTLLIRSLGLENFVRQIFAFQPLSDLALKICSGLVNHQPLAEALKKDYDVILVENFNSDCVLGLLHVYGIKAPVISLVSCAMLQWSSDRVGLPDNPSYVPTITSAISSIGSFSERLENTAMQLYFKLWFRYSIQVKERIIIERRFKRMVPDLDVLARNVSLMLVNTFHSLNGVRPLLPGVVEVGGMHVNHGSSQTIPHYRLYRGAVYSSTMWTLSLTLFAILAGQDVHTARILGLFPHPGRSHQMVFDPLMRALAERGHDVTVVSFFPIKDPPPNYTTVSLEGVVPLAVETVDLSYYENPSRILKFLGIDRIIKHLMEFQPLADLGVGICSKIVDFAPLADALKKTYDVFLVENFNSDCVLGLAHVYGLRAPMVSMSAVTIMEWGPDRIGQTDNPSYVPILSCGFTTKMNFIQRLENAVMNAVYKIWYRYGVQMKEQEIIEKKFGRKIPDLQDLAKNTSLILLNAFHSLNGVRPLLPGLVEVGGSFLNYSRNSIPSVST
ncbi:hypothetical protein PYW08_002006 [Mythimna loreyi]|uniref:Uncharacterized protein n=1 Tax=Mythimna loreyi TaxID=667449 RepID=A0ACC2R4W7_9NEOP|nr:hypothetical protein PYW08_002006 [Mythimna loreyi]